jgi:hypothetical protein
MLCSISHNGRQSGEGRLERAFSEWVEVGDISIEIAARAFTGRLISATAGSRPVPSLNFGEAVKVRAGFAASDCSVRHAVQLTKRIIDKFLSTIETEN